MTENKYTEFIRKYRNTANAALSDADMAKAVGGVGGADEATCPKCGQPMLRFAEPGGPQSDVWHCDACDTYQLATDAEYIQMVRDLEHAGITDIVYPVWWNNVPK